MGLKHKIAFKAIEKVAQHMPIPEPMDRILTTTAEKTEAVLDKTVSCFEDKINKHEENLQQTRKQLSSKYPNHNHLWVERVCMINEMGPSTDFLQFLDDKDVIRFYAEPSSKGFEIQNEKRKRIAKLIEKRSITPKVSLFNSHTHYMIKKAHKEIGQISIIRTTKTETLSLNDHEIIAEKDNNCFSLVDRNGRELAEIHKLKSYIFFIDCSDSSQEMMVLLFSVLIAYNG